MGNTLLRGASGAFFFRLLFVTEEYAGWPRGSYAGIQRRVYTPSGDFMNPAAVCVNLSVGTNYTGTVKRHPAAGFSPRPSSKPKLIMVLWFRRPGIWALREPKRISKIDLFSAMRAEGRPV